jgi:hypothetical protein
MLEHACQDDRILLLPIGLGGLDAVPGGVGFQGRELGHDDLSDLF